MLAVTFFVASRVLARLGASQGAAGTAQLYLLEHGWLYGEGDRARNRGV